MSPGNDRKILALLGTGKVATAYILSSDGVHYYGKLNGWAYQGLLLNLMIPLLAISMI